MELYGGFTETKIVLAEVNGTPSEIDTYVIKNK